MDVRPHRIVDVGDALAIGDERVLDAFRAAAVHEAWVEAGVVEVWHRVLCNRRGTRW